MTERITRSRARTLAATGETPSLAALPDKTPAGRTTRRQAAAAAAAAQECGMAPAVLFDMTNDQAATGADAPVAQPQHEWPVAAAPDAAGTSSPPADNAPPAAEEPPATPAGSLPASPARLVLGATPTGLGLSSLAPQSPVLTSFGVPATTPAATPLAGVDAAADRGKVADALAAAVEALGGAPAGASPAQPQVAEPMFLGFGSPVKQGGDSPSVSIGTAIGAAPGLVAAPGAAAVSPAAAGAPSELEADVTSAAGGPYVELAFEQELTLEEMMGSPLLSDREGEHESPAKGSPTGTFTLVPAVVPPAPGSAARAVGASSPKRAATACTGTTPASVLMRTAPRQHPLTPARQVVLEQEEQDYVMQAEEEEEGYAGDEGELEAEGEQQGDAAAEAAYESDATVDADMAGAEVAGVEPYPAPQATKPRVASKVVVPSPHTFDPRSLRQLRREIADKLAAKQAGAPAGTYSDYGSGDDEEGDYIGTAAGEELAEELGGLSLEGGMRGPLKGLPTPAGQHIRFDEEGEVAAVSPRQRVFLRGVAQPAGTHIHFDDQE